MYINSGYLNNSRIPFKDKSKPLIVGSCGTYRLRTHERLPTWRPRGRLDYQLLYVASGKTVFYFNGEPKEVAAGHMVLNDKCFGDPEEGRHRAGLFLH